MARDLVVDCRFITDRLVVDEWRRLASQLDLDLVDVVSTILTEATTPSLPTDWRGDFDAKRSVRWIEDRDAESPTMLVVERAVGRGVGLLILFEEPTPSSTAAVDIRFGYVLAESAWGRGLATELVGGLVAWARDKAEIGRLLAGVEQGNDASARVLVKNGFAPNEAADGQQTYELTLARPDRRL